MIALIQCSELCPLAAIVHLVYLASGCLPYYSKNFPKGVLGKYAHSLGFLFSCSLCCLMSGLLLLACQPLSLYVASLAFMPGVGSICQNVPLGSLAPDASFSPALHGWQRRIQKVGRSQNRTGSRLRLNQIFRSSEATRTGAHL